LNDEATLHLSGKVSHHNIHFWGEKVIKHDHDYTAVRVLCAVSLQTISPSPMTYQQETFILIWSLTYAAASQQCLNRSLSQ
jgi:hypothetical protein